MYTGTKRDFSDLVSCKINKYVLKSNMEFIIFDKPPPAETGRALLLFLL